MGVEFPWQSDLVALVLEGDPITSYSSDIISRTAFQKLFVDQQGLEVAPEGPDAGFRFEIDAIARLQCTPQGNLNL